MTTSPRGRDLASSDVPNRTRRRPGGRRPGGSRNGMGRPPQADPSLEQLPDIDPTIPVLHIADLEARPREDLIEMAEEEFEIDGAGVMLKQELIFRILEAQAERNGTIFSGGVLNVVDDGFGFLRGERLLPGPNDVYVSQSQIRRFGLRSGDYVTGQVRQPKTSEKYYGLLRVDAVNGMDPEEAKRRPDFDSLTPIFPNRKFRLETAQHEVSQRTVDLF